MPRTNGPFTFVRYANQHRYLCYLRDVRGTEFAIPTPNVLPAFDAHRRSHADTASQSGLGATVLSWDRGSYGEASAAEGEEVLAADDDTVTTAEHQSLPQTTRFLLHR